MTSKATAIPCATTMSNGIITWGRKTVARTTGGIAARYTVRGRATMLADGQPGPTSPPPPAHSHQTGRNREATTVDPMFDSLTVARQLTAAGIDRGHAEALADAIRQAASTSRRRGSMPVSPNYGPRSLRWNPGSTAPCLFKPRPLSVRWSASLE